MTPEERRADIAAGLAAKVIDWAEAGLHEDVRLLVNTLDMKTAREVLIATLLIAAGRKPQDAEKT